VDSALATFIWTSNLKTSVYKQSYKTGEDLL